MIRARDFQAFELACLAKLVYAIDRLPMSTVGVAIEASICISHERGNSWMGIQHYGDSLSLYSGGTLYEIQGPESEINDILRVEIGCENNRNDDDPMDVMVELEDWVRDWSESVIDSEFAFKIHDDSSDINWEQTIIDNAWAELPEGT